MANLELQAVEILFHRTFANSSAHLPSEALSHNRTLLTRTEHSMPFQDRQNRLYGLLATCQPFGCLVIPTPCQQAASTAFLSVGFDLKCEFLSVLSDRCPVTEG
ncbi:hypothetical protein [Streptomyces atratus]